LLKLANPKEGVGYVAIAVIFVLILVILGLIYSRIIMK